MEAIIIAGIIGAVGTILAPIIRLGIQSWLENRKLVKLSPRRQSAIEGRWTGNMTYERSKKSPGKTVPCAVEFSIRGKIVRGKLDYGHQDTGENVTLNLHGGFYDQFFLKCDYENTDGKVVQFGAIIFKLSGDALRLTALLQGFGRQSEELVSCFIELKRRK